MFINALVEGIMDEAAAQRIIAATGHKFGICYGKRGCAYIRKRVSGFNAAATAVPYLTLVDHMDTELSCPPEVVSRWVPHRRPLMLLRVVVRELESWLLADRQNLAEFLKVSLARIPRHPEGIEDPKRTLINAARRSRSPRMRDALVPKEGSTAQVGPLYASEMIRFIHQHWNIDAARGQSPSMDRCLRRLQELHSTA